MTTESFLTLWGDTELRQHIVDTAKALSRDRKVQKDLVGHAWFRLGEADPQKTAIFYKRYVSMLMGKREELIRYKEVKIS